MKHRMPVIIGIAGGTGSGKSTFTNRLKDEFKDQVTVIYHDNYYRAHDELPFEERKLLNYDHPDAFETELLLRHLELLKAGKTIECPTYDYSRHNRAKETMRIEPAGSFFWKASWYSSTHGSGISWTSRCLWTRMRTSGFCGASCGIPRSVDVMWKISWTST